MNGNFVHIWEPFEAFQSLEVSEKNLALIILNQPISVNNDLKLVKLWRKSVVRFCVDGGANQFSDWKKRLLSKPNKFSEKDYQEIQQFNPDYICGDFDSIDSSIIENYKSKGTKCFRLENQDLNDFQKTIRFAVNCIKEGKTDEEIFGSSKYCPSKEDLEQLTRADFTQIYSVCNFSGRIDHSLANFHSLYLDCIQSLQTYILSHESANFLLRKGINIIYVDNDSYCEKHCGYFPLGRPARVTTYGLKWDVFNRKMEFGSCVSSSNQFSAEPVSEKEKQFIADNCLRLDLSRKHVLIQTDQPLIWTMSIK